MTFNNKTLAKYDILANTLTVKEVANTSLNNILLRDMDWDGQAELLIESENGVWIFDQNFNLLAHKVLPGPVFLSVRLRGPNLPPEIGVSAKDRFYQFRAISNPLFKWLPALFSVLLILLTLIIFYANRLATRLYIYFSYFVYSVRETPNAILILLPGGHIFYFNNRLQSLLNTNGLLQKKRTYREALSAFPEIMLFIKESLTSGEVQRKELFISSESAEIHGRIMARPFKTKFGRIIAWMMEIQDFSGPLLSDRHKTWSHTVRKIVHGIKTPLGSVLLNIERIQQKLEDSSPDMAGITADDFAMTMSEIRRIQEMARQFLKFTKLEELDIRPLQFNEVLDKTLAPFQAFIDQGVQIECVMEQEPHTVHADPRQLEMALQIFIENSIDALDGKGKILISTVLAQNLERNFANELEIEIADNGPGIPREVQGQVFEPFFTTKKDGTGMGLVIARKIIHDHDVRVELVSRENFGTVFRITLPAFRK